MMKSPILDTHIKINLWLDINEYVYNLRMSHHKNDIDDLTDTIYKMLWDMRKGT